jgi:hypothetical protein
MVYEKELVQDEFALYFGARIHEASGKLEDLCSGHAPLQLRKPRV